MSAQSFRRQDNVLRHCPNLYKRNYSEPVQPLSSSPHRKQKPEVTAYSGMREATAETQSNPLEQLRFMISAMFGMTSNKKNLHEIIT